MRTCPWSQQRRETAGETGRGSHSSQRISMGESVVEVLNYLLSSLSLDSVSTVMELELVAKVFNPTKLPRHAWILDI